MPINIFFIQRMKFGKFCRKIINVKERQGKGSEKRSNKEVDDCRQTFDNFEQIFKQKRTYIYFFLVFKQFKC